MSKGGGGFIWARKSSPRGPVSSRKREKVRPARLKHPKFGVFVLAGRVFSRKSRWRGRAGRVFSRRLALRPGLVGVEVHFRLTAVGVLRHAKPSGGVSPACRRLGWRNSPGWWWRGRASRWCGRQSADPLGEKRRKRAVLAEWVCTLAYSVSVVACCSHANPLLQA